MNVLGSLASGFAAGLANNNDTASAAPDGASGDSMFSKWMDNAAVRQRASTTQKPAEPARDKVAERQARQSATQQQDARRSEASEGSRAAAETEQASEASSASKTRETDQDQDDRADDDNAPAAAWPPPGLAA
ncbi:MAG: hypothetical protein ABW178_01950, partial [Pseudoxanthomonas sp.]